MSERPTDTRSSRAAAAHGHARDERAHGSRAGSQARAGGPSVAQRAANFRQGAPFLVERATLYDPEPLDPPDDAPIEAGPPPRRLVPAALTLLGVVVVVGLASGVLLVRNANVARNEDDARRLELFAERARPPEGPGQTPGAQPNASTIAYDLTRRPNDVIVGAWRPGAEGGSAEPSEVSSAESKRRSLPRRASLTRRDAPPEVVTRPVAAVSPRYETPEPKRGIVEGEPAQAAQAEPASTAAEDAERPGASVVARVDRASEPIEVEGPAVEIPLEKLALPLRRPDPAMLEEAREARADSARWRRARLLRALRRQQRHDFGNDPAEVRRARETAFGDWFVGTHKQRP